MDHRLTSTFNTSAVISYVRRRRPEAVPTLLEGMGELAVLEPERLEEVLGHPGRWVSLEVFSELVRRVREDVFQDPQVAYRIAFEAMAFFTWGPLKSLFMRFVGTPANLARGAPWLVHRFTRSIRSLTISGLHQDGCTLHLRWHDDLALSHDNCLFTMGCLAALPLCLGRPPARLEEQACFFENGRETVLVMTWAHLPLRERIRTLIYGVNARRARFLVDSLNEHVRQVELLSRQSRDMAEALAQEQERFRALTEQSPLGLATLDASGRFIYTNPAFYSMFGYQPTQFPDKNTWLRLAFPDAAQRRRAAAAWKADQAAAGENGVRERTFRVRCRDGKQKDVLFRLVGLPGGEHFLLAEDFSRRLAADRELKRSEALLRSVVEGSPDAIILVDEQGKVVMANRAAARLFSGGLPPQGKQWVDLLPPERLAWGRDLLAWVTRGKVAREEVELPVASGVGPATFELMAASFDQGLIFFSLRNISHRRRLEEQRREAARLAGVVEVAGAAAHELNQPLTSLLASGEMMRMYHDPADLKRQARRMVADAQSLAAMVERFGRVVRYETKEYLPGRTILDLERAAAAAPAEAAAGRPRGGGGNG